MKKGTIIALCISIPVGLMCAITVAVLYFLGLFMPAYPYHDGVLQVDGKPYAYAPNTNWQPKGETVRIGRTNEAGLVYVYSYKGDEQRFFMLTHPLIADMVSLPMHRTDITLPSFSPDVIDNVNLSFDGNMIRQDNAEYVQKKITEKESITLLANCFSNPIKQEKPYDDSGHFSISGESAKYPWMTYKLDTAIYDGKYYLIGLDRMMYEVPVTVLEQVSGLDLYSAQEMLAVTNIKRDWQNKKWNGTGKCENCYMFLSQDTYVILEVKEKKATLKERGDFRLDGNQTRFYPENDGSPYTFTVGNENMQLSPTDGDAQYSEWNRDDGDVSVLTGEKYNGEDVFQSIKQTGFEYLYERK